MTTKLMVRAREAAFASQRFYSLSQFADASTSPIEPRIVSTPDVCGGDYRIRGTRIAVKTLAKYMALGVSNHELLKDFPTLEQADLDAAREFSRALEFTL